jgi:PleD family two-component response regulator
MRRKKILLVDDSKTALLIEKMILKRYEIDVAHDGQEGFDKATADPPDLILLDVVMPRMNGLETCRRLRGHASTRAVPIIMVTTRSELGNVETAFANGCTEYVTKPIDAPELLSKVRNIIGE